MASPASIHTTPTQRRESLNLAYVWLYTPALFAWLLVFDPLLSFGVAWSGSWLILWLSMSGRIRPLPGDRRWKQQLFRPLFLSQGLFFVLFSLGPIFRMWDLVASGGVVGGTAGEIQRVAAAQRYYVLGHAAFIHGVLVYMDYRRSGEWELQTEAALPRIFLYAALAGLSLMFLVGSIPGLGQLVVKFRNIAVVGAVLALGYALREGDRPLVLIGTVVYAYILYEALLGGWKHQVMILMGLFLYVIYPKYRKTASVLGVAALIFFATLLPAYNAVFRQLSWGKEVSTQKAAEIAVDRVVEGEVDIEEKSWSFLKGRLTTVGLFSAYIESVPSETPYYGFQIPKQAAYSIIPRVIWPSKPNTERVVMQRVYKNTYISPQSGVSAKPLLVVDGYLSAGVFGVLAFCFLVGCAASAASVYAERWLGGYKTGSELMYTALFAGAIFTASLEFMLNAVFWSFASMFVCHIALKYLGFLKS